MDKISADILNEAFGLGFDLYGIYKRAEMGDVEAQTYINEAMKQAGGGNPMDDLSNKYDNKKAREAAEEQQKKMEDAAKKFGKKPTQKSAASPYAAVPKPPVKKPTYNPTSGVQPKDPKDTGDRVGKQSSANYYPTGYVNPYFKQAGMAPGMPMDPAAGGMPMEAPMAAPEPTITCPQCSQDVVPGPEGLCPVCGFDFNQGAIEAGPSQEELDMAAQQIKTAAVNDPQVAYQLLVNYQNVQ